MAGEKRERERESGTSRKYIQRETSGALLRSVSSRLAQGRLETIDHLRFFFVLFSRRLTQSSLSKRGVCSPPLGFFAQNSVRSNVTSHCQISLQRLKTSVVIYFSDALHFPQASLPRNSRGIFKSFACVKTSAYYV